MQRATRRTADERGGRCRGRDREEAAQRRAGPAGRALARSAPEASTPEPAPDPEVSVNFTGPFNVRSDNVVLKGTVHPSTSHVRIKGESVEVRHGHWKLPVTLTKHGDNTFRVVGSRK